MKPYYLSDDYRINTDERSYTLERRHVPAKGKDKGVETWATEGWWPDLGMAARAGAKRLVIESEEELPEAVRQAVAALDGLRSDTFREPEP